MIMNYSGSPLLLIYPTKPCKSYLKDNKDIYTDDYIQTKDNWINNGY